MALRRRTQVENHGTMEPWEVDGEVAILHRENWRRIKFSWLRCKRILMVWSSDCLFWNLHLISGYGGFIGDGCFLRYEVAE